MSVAIRLTKTGKKGESKYRLVVKEKRSKRDGKALEILGWYEKRVSGEKKEINKERLNYWLSKGAQTSQTVSKIIK
ncbi:30S ribosomal protein S16 [Candidatus Microgenomates bacterium]|nr:MAG: 30S ribosomal protein S16 [Candidatus Microgenomates bacterium]